MKKTNIGVIVMAFFFLFALSVQVDAKNKVNKDKLTAESVYDLADGMETIDAEIIKNEIKLLSVQEKVKLAKLCIQDAKDAKDAGLRAPQASIGLYILALFIPPLAVAIYTDLGMETAWNILWTFCGGLPGVIHAFIVLSR